MAEWKISNDLPYLDEFPALYQLSEYPNTIWHQVNGELPYKTSFPELIRLSAPYPSSLWIQIPGELPYKTCFPSFYTASAPVHQSDYICAYDLHCDQNDFDNNGLCILCPTRCEITEELNGSYELSLEHPIDPEGRWKTLLELNIIKANGQLFRIYRKNTIMSSDGSKLRTVYARHIFYDLNDKLLEDVRPENKKGQEFITWIMAGMLDSDGSDYYPFYDYSWYSDIEKTATAYYVGTSPVAALIGEDNCFINRLGGELYRDNFYFSINERKEKSVEDAFNISYGIDMIDVEEDIDYSDFITHLIAKDNFGQGFGVGYVETPRLHHIVTKLVNFNYESANWDAFVSDSMNYFKMHSTPKINYKVTYANLQNCELYKDFIEMKRCNVGDTGKIFCEELGIETIQKVVKKTIDCLTGNTVSIELGNLNSSLTRLDKFSSTISSGSAAEKSVKAQANSIREVKIASLKTWEDAKGYKWNELTDITWQEVLK